MKIVDLLKRESVELNGKVTSKPEAIEKMVALMVAGGNLADVEAYKKGVFAREEESTTGIGEGIAIPHAKTAAVKAPGLAAMVVKDGVDYDSLDGEPAKLIFPDCSTGYRRQCASGSVKPSVHASYGSGFQNRTYGSGKCRRIFQMY